MIKVLDLSEDSSRSEIINVVGNKVLDTLCSRMGPGFQIDRQTNPDNLMIWNALKLDLSRWEKLDVLIEHVLLDIARTE